MFSDSYLSEILNPKNLTTGKIISHLSLFGRIGQNQDPGQGVSEIGA